jgi:hypothetical protein
MADARGVGYKTISGNGTPQDPLLIDGVPFSGNFYQNNVTYKDGVPVVYKGGEKEFATTGAISPTSADWDQYIRSSFAPGAMTGITVGTGTGAPMPGSVAPTATGMERFNFIPVAGMSPDQREIYAQFVNDPNITGVFLDEGQNRMYFRMANGSIGSDPGWFRNALGIVRPLSEKPTTGTAVSSSGFVSTSANTNANANANANDGDGNVSTSGNVATDPNKAARQSAYDLLLNEMNAIGLGFLVTPLKGLIESNLPPSEFKNELRKTFAYRDRFAANAERAAKGLRQLTEAEYLATEDMYQEIMRRYGLPDTYYTKTATGAQPSFNKLIAADVSSTELEDRLQTAYNRVINAAPEVSKALKQFYPDITNGDILAYTLDPKDAIEKIKRKVTAAEIGAGALQSGLFTGVSRAEELATYGVTGAAARQGYQSIAEFLQPTQKLGDIYRRSGMGPYTQTTAEQEVFGIAGSTEAATKRKKLAELETAQFSGSSGAAKSALSRERAGQF